MKKRYIICFTGVLQQGYLKLALFRKNSELKLTDRFHGHEFATKFRWRWVANFFRWIFEFNSERSCDLRTWKIKEISIK